MCIAVVTPPVGLCTYVTKSIAGDVPIAEIIRGTIPFIVQNVIAVCLLCVFPQIALWLPNMMMG
ncbi:TRAP transporter large permease subunit [Chloroflexota bacterium]